ncbi:hypothetical protein FIBSPDRAFT_873933 [Athelia psychrophila]|uniref:Uncharacterized protein n=1 Tax=Athelia psychrophila TaxID=1759441 RepID=A0A165Y1H5_9AGAM|nr:hypothetical protein FIBSPDRAFT_873933 [Fibularhizoctonia sp. CBS 109695]
MHSQPHPSSVSESIAEGRLDFNTNTRLFTAAKGWASPNGWLMSSTSVIFLWPSPSYETAFSAQLQPSQPTSLPHTPLVR